MNDMEEDVVKQAGYVLQEDEVADGEQSGPCRQDCG